MCALVHNCGYPRQPLRAGVNYRPDSIQPSLDWGGNEFTPKYFDKSRPELDFIFTMSDKSASIDWFPVVEGISKFEKKIFVQMDFRMTGAAEAMQKLSSKEERDILQKLILVHLSAAEIMEGLAIVVTQGSKRGEERGDFNKGRRRAFFEVIEDRIRCAVGKMSKKLQDHIFGARDQAAAWRSFQQRSGKTSTPFELLCEMVAEIDEAEKAKAEANREAAPGVAGPSS